MLLHKLGFIKSARGGVPSQTSGVSNFFKGVGNTARSTYDSATALKNEITALPAVRTVNKVRDIYKSRTLPLYNTKNTNINLQVPKDANKGTWQLNLRTTF
jgi:hypothetical protein